jgi:predicted secreted protein
MSMCLHRSGALLLLSAFLAACNPGKPPADSNVAARRDARFIKDHAIPTMVNIGSNHADAPVHLKAGDVLRVRLLASPASGYHWLLEPEVPVFLRAETDPGFGPGRAPGIVNVWTFRAQAPGHGALRFSLRRAWESRTAPIRSLAFAIYVH